MHVSVFCGFLMGVPIAIACGMHYQNYGHWNALAQSLIGFLVVNTVICLWELALFYYFDDITATHQRRIKEGFYRNDKEGAAIRSKDPIIVFRDYPLRELCSLRVWAQVWADYGRYDLSYTEKNSYGFAIDVGNGHSTLALSVLLLVSFVSPIWSPRVTGIMAIIMFYQKMYGTFLYVFSYVVNKRYYLSTWPEIIFAVAATNGLWILFPILGFCCGVDMIMTDSFALIQ